MVTGTQHPDKRFFAHKNSPLRSGDQRRKDVVQPTALEIQNGNAGIRMIFLNKGYCLLKVGGILVVFGDHAVGRQFLDRVGTDAV